MLYYVAIYIKKNVLLTKKYILSMQIVMQSNGAVKFTTVRRIPAAEIQSFQQESTWSGISHFDQQKSLSIRKWYICVRDVFHTSLHYLQQTFFPAKFH